ncbi:hypothetical protein M231_03097 [Tremella mesenterica]|uniref:DUF7587 domain-containing protein n=1 Tax=Tremella mesenterica TaxID=5217 RepID=A0A4Q1BNY1_TREME|nr:uncharacterized protein TREMEDRAFT_63017 [Tremella mesenterica DSM 1558]EIW68551.1 hypothetical protein TREMEDRAFT_63017 [Tremella mesenterica DSM 1558]RXK39595.1 hypothetical protein M231_03097 [Tremella mesenterica]
MLSPLTSSTRRSQGQIHPADSVRKWDDGAKKDEYLFRTYHDDSQSKLIPRAGFTSTDSRSARLILEQVRSLGIPTEGCVIGSDDACDLFTLNVGTRHPAYHCTKGWTGRENYEHGKDLASPYVSVFSSFLDVLYHALSLLLVHRKSGVTIAVIKNLSLTVLDPSDIIAHPGVEAKALPIYGTQRWEKAGMFSHRHGERLVVGSIPAASVEALIPVRRTYLGVNLPPEYLLSDFNPNRLYHENLRWNPYEWRTDLMHHVRARVHRIRYQLEAGVQDDSDVEDDSDVVSQGSADERPPRSDSAMMENPDERELLLAMHGLSTFWTLAEDLLDRVSNMSKVNTPETRVISLPP